MSRNKDRLETKKILYFAFAVFVIMFVFYTQQHPLVLFDTDDWAGFSGARYAVPSLNYFNPTRILPEIAMPVCAYLAVYFVAPFHGFIDSIMLVTAFILCLVIVVYLIAILYFFKNEFALSSTQSIIISLFYFMFHFLMFRSMESGNTFLFYSSNITNYFFYLMPAMLNIILLFHLNQKKQTLSSNRYDREAVWILMVYLCICSNLFCSYILAIGESIFLLKSFMKNKGRLAERITYTIHENRNGILIIILWIITMFFELNGGRADSVSMKSSIFQNIGDTVHYLKTVILSINRYFFIFSILCIMVSAVLVIKTGMDEKQNREFLTRNFVIGLLIILYFIYVILLCATTYPSYILRSDILIGPCSMILVFICNCIGFIVIKFPYSRTSSCLILLVMASFLNTSGKTFLDSNCGGIPSRVCKTIDEDIIRKCLDADQRGETDIEIRVPKWKTEDNWPLAGYGAHRVGHCLYKFGITTREIMVVFIADETMNEKYHINQ